MRKVNIAFFGSPRPAVLCLSEIVKHYSVKLVVTKKDKATGRGRKIRSTPVKILAHKNTIPAFQPERIDDNIIKVLKNLHVYSVNIMIFFKIQF